MTFQGHIENGQVILDSPLSLPDGVKVVVSVPEEPAAPPAQEDLPTLYERMESVIGKAKGLPSDYAINHDHYLHGQPKRQ